MNSVEYIVAAGIALAEKYEREIRELKSTQDQALGIAEMAATTPRADKDELDVILDATKRLRERVQQQGYRA